MSSPLVVAIPTGRAGAELSGRDKIALFVIRIDDDSSVRSDESLDSVKIICISGMVEQDKVAELRVAGANDFLQKPFGVDKLLERVCDLLEMERAVAG